MDRYWLLTWTTYGSWLPGDARGFVGNVAGRSGRGVRHNQPGTEYDADHPGLKHYMESRLQQQPIFLGADQAAVLVEQFQETARYRQWCLLATAVMKNHVHVVVGAGGDPDPDTLLRDFKSYGSRTLNRRWSKPPAGTWWTESGSRRKLPDEAAVRAAVIYVADRQPNPLATWKNDSLAHLGSERGA
jgi:REP element-mobilizing transposase RayT